MKRLFLLAAGALALLATTAAPAGAGSAATTASSALCLETSEFSSLTAITRSAATAKGWTRDAPARLNVGDSNYEGGLAPNVPAGFPQVTSATNVGGGCRAAVEGGRR